MGPCVIVIHGVNNLWWHRCIVNMQATAGWGTLLYTQTCSQHKNAKIGSIWMLTVLFLLVKKKKRKSHFILMNNFSLKKLPSEKRVRRLCYQISISKRGGVPPVKVGSREQMSLPPPLCASWSVQPICGQYQIFHRPQQQRWKSQRGWLHCDSYLCWTLNTRLVNPRSKYLKLKPSLRVEASCKQKPVGL